MDISQYLTIAEAAKALGYASGSTLSTYCQQGRVPGVIRVGRSWLIPKVWVEEEAENPSIIRQGGRGSSRKSHN